MPANYPVPAHERLRDVLTDLMGRAVAVDRVRPVDLGGGRPAALADYATDVGAIGVVCVADVRLTNALGAALTMVSPSIVEDAIAAMSIDQPTVDNFREVVNVLTTLFNSQDTPHVKFRNVHCLPTQLPAETAKLLESARARRDFDVHVEDYGTGTLSVLVG
jgi:hypothetical protein